VLNNSKPSTVVALEVVAKRNCECSWSYLLHFQNAIVKSNPLHSVELPTWQLLASSRVFDDILNKVIFDTNLYRFDFFIENDLPKKLYDVQLTTPAAEPSSLLFIVGPLNSVAPKVLKAGLAVLVYQDFRTASQSHGLVNLLFLPYILIERPSLHALKGSEPRTLDV